MKFLKEIYTKYISLNTKDYLGENFDFQINKVLILLAIGLCIACVFINYNQRLVSSLLRKLIRLDAFSEESSKTLKDLGLADHKATKTLVSKNFGAIKRVLGVVGRKSLTYEEYIAAEKAKKEAKKARLTKKTVENSDAATKNEPEKESTTELDFSVARFFIIADERAYAERYIHRDTSHIKTAIYCILIASFFAVLIFTMPYILNAVRTMF